MSRDQESLGRMDQVEIIQRGVQGADLPSRTVNLGFNCTVLTALMELLQDDRSVIECKLENMKTGIVLSLVDLGIGKTTKEVKDYYGDWWNIRLCPGAPWARIRFFQGPKLNRGAEVEETKTQKIVPFHR